MQRKWIPTLSGHATESKWRKEKNQCTTIGLFDCAAGALKDSKQGGKSDWASFHFLHVQSERGFFFSSAQKGAHTDIQFGCTNQALKTHTFFFDSQTWNSPRWDSSNTVNTARVLRPRLRGLRRTCLIFREHRFTAQFEDSTKTKELSITFHN